MTDRTAALCALNRIFGYHPAAARELISLCGGNPLDVFLSAPDIPGHPELSCQLNQYSLEWAVKELQTVNSTGARFISIEDEDYPDSLLECDDAPLGIYMKSSCSPTEVFSLRPMIAFVGTRDMSPYGKLWCQKLVRSLAQVRTPPSIVSGLALGADATAHATALECGIPTVGVMATGIDSVYPWRHTDLARNIAACPGGALITDYPLGTSPVALNFLRRNRIIAGLVRAVVVIESKTKGGSLMTARFACDYSRDVFAVPGRLDDIRSAGCNSLISTHMAELICSPEDLASKLGLSPQHRGPGGSWAVVKRQGKQDLKERLEKQYGPGSACVRVAMAVMQNCGIGADQISASTGLPLQEVLSCIGILEAGGVICTDLLRRCSITPGFS